MSDRGDVDLRKSLDEGMDYIERDDLVQTSEKLYKAAEEDIEELVRAAEDRGSLV